jgi:hypothetical protein
VFSADLVYVALHDTATDMIDFAYYSEATSEARTHPCASARASTSRILQTRVPLLLNRPEAFQEPRNPIVGTPAKSYLGVPIIAGTAAIGVISVQSMQRAGRFRELDSRLLSTIAANVGGRDPERPSVSGDGRRASEMAALAELGREVGGPPRARPDPGQDRRAGARAARRRYQRRLPREEHGERFVPSSPSASSRSSSCRTRSTPARDHR